MPNWCLNTLQIVGPADSIADMSLFVRGDAVVEVQEGGTIVPTTSLSLEKIAPMPSELKERPRTPTKPGSYPEWLEWRIDNWGTKWDVEAVVTGIGPESLTMEFSSAWTPPIAAIVQLSERFPDLKFDFSFEEPGNEIGGRRLIQDGMTIASEDKRWPIYDDESHTYNVQFVTPNSVHTVTVESYLNKDEEEAIIELALEFVPPQVLDGLQSTEIVEA